MNKRFHRLIIVMTAAMIVFACGVFVNANTVEKLTLDVTYGDVKCGQEVEFKMKGSGGGSGEYKYLFNSAYLNSNANRHYLFDSSYSKNLKENPSSNNNSGYQDEDTFNFTFYASGQYELTFYVMSKTAPDSTTSETARKTITINVDDSNYPTVEAKADAVAEQCVNSGAKTDYEKALWLHDWLTDNCDYDYKYLYCSAEGALCRGTGTCEAYHRAYEMLLDRVGIEHGRMEGNGHVWTAVKMDGEWYQVDVTWDEYNYSYEKDFWSHLYFGLTDELMTIAHSEHKENTGYESNSLENNYLIKSGGIKTYSDKYVNAAKEKIGNGETDFELSISESKAPSVDPILFTLVAYQMKKELKGYSCDEVDATYADNKIICKVKYENSEKADSFELIDDTHAYFGSYPQTEIVSKASDSGVYNKEWAQESDYIVDESLYSTLSGLSEDQWDDNGDAIIGGNKYRRIKSNDATGTKASDTKSSEDESTSNKPSEEDTVSMYYGWSSSDTYHYFKYEPIKWRILQEDDNDMFLMSELVLDDQQYNPVLSSHFTWENSTIRSWLNGYEGSTNLEGTDYTDKNFIDIAFTSEEQKKIKTTTIANKENVSESTSENTGETTSEDDSESDTETIKEGTATDDKIYLLSDDEVYTAEYGFSNGSMKDNTARQAKSSTYAKAMGTKSNDSGNCYWWLRTPGSHSGLVVLVRDSGSVYTGGQHASSKSRGIRPALHIDTSSTEEHIWDEGEITKNPTCTEKGEKTFHCTVDGCNETKTEEIKENGHNYVNHTSPAGYMSNGESYDKCTVCGNVANYRTLEGYSTSYVKSFKVKKGSKGKFTAKWKKQSKKNQKKFNGYQVRWSTDPGMSGAGYKNVSKKKASVNIKGARKTRYYVQVRTYTGGYYSNWSAMKSVVTK